MGSASSLANLLNLTPGGLKRGLFETSERVHLADTWTTSELTGSYELPWLPLESKRERRKFHTNWHVQMWFANLLVTSPWFRLDHRERC